MADRSVTNATLLGAWSTQYNLLVGDVGDVDLLDTTASNLVGAINELHTEIGDVGDATTLNGQSGAYYLDYGNFTNTPTIPTNNNQLTNGAGYITGYTVTQGDVTQYQANLTILTSQLSGDVALGTGTSGNYVATVAGTANEIEVTGSGSETAAVTIGLPNDVTVTGTLTAGDVHAPATVQASRTGNLQLADANKIVIATGNIVVTDDTFAQGDVIVIASSASRTISDDTNLTLYSNGSAVTSVTLAANGSCGILFTGTNTAIITGNVS